MPSQLEPALEERFGELLGQVRATRVEPSSELRERVRLIGRLEPAPRRTLFRRRVVALAFAAALLVGGAVVAGVVGERGGRQESAAGQATAQLQQGGGGEDRSARELAPVQTARIQDFRADLTIRVDEADDLPGATRRAMQIAQSLGGYVVSAQWGGGSSDSVMTLRVPIGNAQDAISRLSALGALAGQRYSLQDLQENVDALDAQADRLEARIAELEQELRDPRLTPRERASLRIRVDRAQRDLDNVLESRDAVAAQGRMAEITLTLTADRVALSSSTGVIGRAVDALANIWEWVVAVLIVGLPFAVLLALAFLLGRRLRRRSNERLLGS
jgi:hypothetical protein